MKETIQEVVTVLTTTKLAKIEAVVESQPGVKVTGYWCGDTLRLDIKGAKKS